MGVYLLGVDLGQAQDYSTIAVVERAELVGEWDAAWFAYRKVTELRLRVLERIPLGTPYQEVVDRVVAVAGSPALADGARYLAVDGTGVGRPVVELLRRSRPAAELMPVIVSPGDQQTFAEGYYRVPKRDLQVGLELLMERGGLSIASDLPYAGELVKEFRSVEVRKGARGREQYGAMRAGAHDDLVFAVALACWAAETVWPAGRREEWWTNRREAEAARVFQEVAREVAGEREFRPSEQDRRLL